MTGDWIPVTAPAGIGGTQEPVAWAVTPTGKDGEIDCEFIYPDAATAGDVALGCDGVVLPLYRPPPPTLTDEERFERASRCEICNGVGYGRAKCYACG